MRTTRRCGSWTARRAIEKTQAQKRPRSLSQSLTLPMLGSYLTFFFFDTSLYFDSETGRQVKVAGRNDVI